MSMKRGVGETFALVFTKELALSKKYVVDLVSWAATVQPLPFFWWCLALPVKKLNQFVITSNKTRF